jgi:malonate decarboxylase delta subunit
MEKMTYRLTTPHPAGGTRRQAIVGVVASGNLEVLVERTLPPDVCSVEIATSVRGFGAVWEAVVTDFVARRPAGGLRITINDSGARPDTVMLRLAQAARLISAEDV